VIGRELMAEPVLQVLSPSQLRDELERAVIADLLGPAGGPEEELDENVRDRYLVGQLAPRAQIVRPEEFDELAVADSGTSEEGATDVSAPQAVTMSPSSFGMTFCVDGAARDLSLTARWGFYDRTDSATLKTPTGQPRRVWKRRQVEGTITPIRLTEGRGKHPWRDGQTLHGAACHACLFAPETSCERGNHYLDRSVLVETVESSNLAFFRRPGTA
jgi:hypothetical protein